ncbi:MAG: heme ABC transporter ATP-binding protein [Actinomycetota bacterium]
MSTITAEGLSLARGGVAVLGEASITATDAELVCIAGPNGAGKSSLLGLLAGDLVPDRGRVTIDGRSVTEMRHPDLARLRAVLPQQHRVAFGFKARAVIDMGRSPHRDPAPELVESLIDRLDLRAILERPFRVLSGGEQARVALARILAQDTPIVLLDEPTAALDLRHQELVMAMARAEADAGRSVIVVVHDLNLAAAYADRIVLLAGGRVVDSGSPAVVLDPKVLETAYGVAVTVTDHPTRDCPLVLTTERPTTWR